MSYENDLKAIEEEVRSIVGSYGSVTENEYEQRTSRMIDAWQERGYDIFNADIGLNKDESGEVVGVTIYLSVHDKREGGVYHLEVEF